MNKDKKKIIITGSAGFIGYSLCTKLLERGYNIIGIDNHKMKTWLVQMFWQYEGGFDRGIDLANI